MQDAPYKIFKPNFKENGKFEGLIRAIGLVILAASLPLLFSCEKVIQLNLKNSAATIVIQGNVYDQPGPYTVKISKSVNFDASSNYPPVSGAKVIISDNVNQSEVLTESASGTYVTSKMRGLPGRTYTLSVQTGTDNYQATAVMPYAVSMDSIYFTTSPFSGELQTTVSFRDPIFSTDYYRLVYFINKTEQKSFYVIDDELFPGLAIHYSLSTRNTDVKLAKGDQVSVWLETVDPGVYDYFRTAGSDSGESASPANPVSNISNGALGYFNACSVRKISALVGNLP